MFLNQSFNPKFRGQQQDDDDGKQKECNRLSYRGIYNMVKELGRMTQVTLLEQGRAIEAAQLKNLTLIHHIDSDVWCLGCNQGVEGIAQVENCYLDTSTDRSWDVSVGIDRPHPQVQELGAEPANGEHHRRQITLKRNQRLPARPVHARVSWQERRIWTVLTTIRDSSIHSMHSLVLPLFREL